MYWIRAESCSVGWDDQVWSLEKDGGQSRRLDIAWSQPHCVELVMKGIDLPELFLLFPVVAPTRLQEMELTPVPSNFHAWGY